MRELNRHEVENLSGGNLIWGVTIGVTSGSIVGGLSYGYDVAISGTEFTWSGFTGSVLQGAVTGALVGMGGYLFTVNGGVVAGVTAEGLAGVITITDPADSLQ